MDIINVDVSTIYKGYFSDASRMFMIGDVNLDMQKLVQVTKECMVFIQILDNFSLAYMKISELAESG